MALSHSIWKKSIIIWIRAENGAWYLTYECVSILSEKDGSRHMHCFALQPRSQKEQIQTNNKQNKKERCHPDKNLE